MIKNILGLGAIAATLALGAPSVASAQPYQGGGYGRQFTTGVVANVNGTNVTLRDGRQIFLKNGTIINPRGLTIRPGQRISIRGTRGGQGAINATEIDLVGRGYGRRY